MFETEWDGNLYTLPDTLKNQLKTISNLNVESSKQEWCDTLNNVGEYCGYLCNTPEGEDSIFPSRRWTFLHHAVHHSAPLSIIQEITERGFCLTLKDAEGKLAQDHCKRDMAVDYKELIEPKFKLPNIDQKKLNSIEKSFHGVILSRVSDLVGKNNLILPNISVILETVSSSDELWFAVPGMYGGFTFKFQLNADKTDVESLITESWCRVAGGSGQRHCCTVDKWELIDEGFV